MTNNLYRVPPSPDLMNHLYVRFLRDGKPAGLSFSQFLKSIGFVDPAAQIDGMDDGLVRRLAESGPSGVDMISVPKKPVTGELRMIVLLVDFTDNVGTRAKTDFESLLFSRNSFPTGSLADYYAEVSGGKVGVTGTVHGWLRMPNTYEYYVDNQSGFGTHPRNSQKLAEDAVAAALAAGVPFDPKHDALGSGEITALFIVHAGIGAEETSSVSAGLTHIWSHKWELKRQVPVFAGRPSLVASRYLTVPENCNMGVCAHELGHLAFQWEDFYDINKSKDGQWAGSGTWDLMAAGSWNGFRGDTPAHPVGLHKLQHGWVERVMVNSTTSDISLAPYDHSGGQVVVIRSPAYTPTQSLLIENRQSFGFDRKLPGFGLLVWRVDIDRQQTGPLRPALALVQADGREDLETAIGGNQGDDGDPFPGRRGITALGDGAKPLTTSFDFPCGVSLSNIKLKTDGSVVFDVNFTSAQRPASLMQPPVDAINNKAFGRVLTQRFVSAADLQPFLTEVTPSVIDIERRAEAVLRSEAAAQKMEVKPKGRKRTNAPTASISSKNSEFGGPLLRAYKWLTGSNWDEHPGEFLGDPPSLAILGDQHYLYVPHSNPTKRFRYRRYDGTVIEPGRMRTDAGSVPRLAWLIEGLDPWTYVYAYLVHDWEFLQHHCNADFAKSFEDVNETLAEGMVTLMKSGKTPADWRKVAVVSNAVSSWVGRGIWEKAWAPESCAAVSV
ncbi:MAG: hypothetical protein RLZZ396_2276 [Planctomycetota bacterium]|jgi:immune inhibitor A